MRIELIPLVLGLLVIAAGVAILADVRGSPERGPMRERRRRMRAVIDRRGEALVGVGFLLVGAALIGRDQWRYETVAVLAGTVLIIVGALFNRRYLREALLFRGPARRGLGDQEQEDRPARRLRIR